MLKLQFRNQPHRSVKLSSAAVTLGRDESNAMVIDDASVSDFHAEIALEAERLYIVDLLSANGTFVNEQRISNRAELQAWDVIRLGNIELEVNDPNKCRPDDWALRAESDLLASQFYVLQPKTVIGRSSECDLTIDSELLSRRHAEISIENGQLRIVDLGSSNGTFLNGVKIEEANAGPGDELRFDKQTFIIVGPGNAAPPLNTDENDNTVMRAQVEDNTVIGAAPQDPNATLVMSLEDHATELIATPQVPSSLVEQTNFLHEPRISLQGLFCQIGRGQDNDIVLSDSSVSKKHAQLAFNNDQWVITDLNSSNGVLINDQRVDDATLQNCDMVKLGRLEFLFESENEKTSGERLASVLFEESKDDDQEAAPKRPSRNAKSRSKSAKPKKDASPWLPGLLLFLVAATAAGVLYMWRSGLL
ncbi:MAG: FHA domain-containing protein [Pseudomonadales bacterium]